MQRVLSSCAESHAVVSELRHLCCTTCFDLESTVETPANAALVFICVSCIYEELKFNGSRNLIVQLHRHFKFVLSELASGRSRFEWRMAILCFQKSMLCINTNVRNGFEIVGEARQLSRTKTQRCSIVCFEFLH